ncbi:hypothetical protein PQO03_12185 [Lentisphaera profundi]|uniref:Cytochrome c domain-containing protein n=1 Tax=Lentisphaera profundi TaxID=1658616 RepID=A0ABY7VXF2_9BACT|nr:hypothetical protein [Lentisphaera profundi]WDE98596.1 hypothetical protein PQO03_12185 [Lentisphaera profundi]
MKYFFIYLLFSLNIIANSILNAEQAVIISDSQAHVTEAKAIEYWSTKDSWIFYKIKIVNPGILNCVIEYATQHQHGAIVELSLANQKIKYEIKNTKGWQTYIQENIGSINIPKAGEYTLTIKPLTIPRGCVMNYKALHFTGTASKNIKIMNRPFTGSMFDYKNRSNEYARQAGFGDKLKSMNPSISYSDISPDLKQFRVSGLDFFSDGRLAISSWDSAGRVYILENPNAPKEEHKYTVFAEGLQEVLGLKIVDDKVYVVQKSELTLLEDQDNDGCADEYICISNKWPVSSNFHEFSFGPLFKDGKFYISLAIAVNPGGATTNPQMKDRGTIIEIDPITGDYKVVTAGLRTPNGLMMNTEGEMFVADNQGDYLPASKIMHIKQGAFYNHTYKPAHPYTKKTVTQPAIWLQQGEIGNSPTQGVFVPHGLYKGHLLIGDIHHGGLKRVVFEKVNDQYQGSLFRFTQGLRAGVNRMAFDSNNTLYLGGAGVSGNWKTNNQKNDGLMKVELYKTKPFEMLKIEAYSDGLTIHFSKRIKPELAWNIQHYQVTQWAYKPTHQYGGPKIDPQKLKITAVSISPDGKKASLKMNGMKANKVLYLRLSNSFQANTGEKLFVGDAYYTLNQIPHNKSLRLNKKPVSITLAKITQVEEKSHPGEALYRTMCMSCHSLDGSKLVGPSFKNMLGRKQTVIENGQEKEIVFNRHYITQSINNPSAQVSKGYQA